MLYFKEKIKSDLRKFRSFSDLNRFTSALEEHFSVDYCYIELFDGDVNIITSGDFNNIYDIEKLSIHYRNVISQVDSVVVVRNLDIPAFLGCDDKQNEIQKSIGFIAACPLSDDAGVTFGSLCLVNAENREDLDENNLDLMRAIAFAVSGLIQRQDDDLFKLLEHELIVLGPMGLIIWKNERHIPLIYLSDNAKTAIGEDSKDLISAGKSFSEILIKEDRQYFSEIMLAISSRATDEAEVSLKINNSTGPERWVKVNLRFKKAFGVELIIGHIVDESIYRQLQEGVRSANQRLSLALESASLGTYDLNLLTRQRTIDERAAMIVGQKHSDVDTSVAAWLDAIHPLDRSAAKRKISGLDLISVDTLQLEYRIKSGDGTYRWIQSYGRIIERFSNGSPMRIIGTMSDITQLKDDQYFFQKQKDILSLISNTQEEFLFNMDVREVCDKILHPVLDIMECQFGFVGLMKVDEHGSRFLLVPSISNISWSDASKDLYEKYMIQGSGFRFDNLDNLFGYVVTENQVVMTNAPETHHASRGLPKGHPQLINFLGIPLRFGSQVVGMIGLGNRSGGFDSRCVEILEPLIATMGALVRAREVEELRKLAEKELQEKAIRDGLTGLYNRRYFEDSARRELQLANRAGAPTSAIIFDIDFFKNINDTKGHAAGDEVIKNFSVLLQEVFRGTDIVSRVGGEEFVVILPNTIATAASIPAERLISLVRNTKVLYQDAEILFTVSAGISDSISLESKSLDNLMKLADEALYRSKSNGRNRATVWSS